MRHIPMYHDGKWVCMLDWCTWTSTDDEEAHNHYHTGMEQLLNELEDGTNPDIVVALRS